MLARSLFAELNIHGSGADVIQEGSKNRSPRRTHEQGILAIVFGLSPHLFPSTTRQIFFQFLQDRDLVDCIG